MPKAAIVYNGFVFPGNSSYEVLERYEYDESETTVTGTVFQIKARAFLAEDASSSVHTLPDFNAGPVVHNARQLLSKAGATLKFEHDGFGPTPQYIEINAQSSGAIVKDINNGPKPRILQWMPVGNTACAEIVWECETTIPICDGDSTPRFTGVKAFNYSIQYDIDASGYTTRRISGYIEIAMTRNMSRGIPDTVDAYRDKVQFQKPNNFSREVSWSVSANKRRADFSIVDKEHRSANPFPPSVIDIQARHRVGWSKGNRVRVPSTISASITLSPLVPRVNAWMIFRAIVAGRVAFANATGKTTFLESLELEEELFANRFSFSCQYYTLTPLGIADVLGATGLFQPLGNTWANWHNSTAILMPFQDLNSDYGLAKLEHDPSDDRIIDLCDNGGATYQGSPGFHLYNTPTAISPYCNPMPTASQSWLRFHAQFEYEEGSRPSSAVTLGPDDLRHTFFNPSQPDANLLPALAEDIERWVEHYAGDITIYWSGYAERVGFPIPRPGKMQIGDEILMPAGKGRFLQSFVGNYFCRPVYRAFWRIPYKCKKRVAKIDAVEAVPSDIETPAEDS